MKEELFSINPATGKVMETHQVMPPEEMDNSIEKGDLQFNEWKSVSIDERTKWVSRLSQLLRDRGDSLATLITNEMGKIIRESKSEVKKCAWLCDYYVENAFEFLKPEEGKLEGTHSRVMYQPLGIILGIMPWNFPFWQVFRFAIPTIIAGNTVLLKHASKVQGCSKTIEGLFHEAGFPDGTFQSLIISSKDMGRIISHPKISAVTLTGSTEAGKSVGEIAGQNLKKTVFELGGNDPYIVLSDAVIPDAVTACLKGRMLNAGQSCISAKRLIVVKEVLENFTNLLTKQVKEMKMGDPLNELSDVGPMIDNHARDSLHDQVLKSLEKGAHLLVGRVVSKKEGAYYPPTILSQVTPGMPAFDEELFGPVAAIIPAEDEEEAVALANKSSFGLGAAVFTEDKEKGKYLAEQKIEAGMCFVNDFVKSDPRLPFGGIKESGYGRELGKTGIREFVNVKTVVERA